MLWKGQKMKRKAFTKAEEKAICKAFRSGVPVKQLTRKYHTGRERIKQCLRDNGLQPPKAVHHPIWDCLCKRCGKRFERHQQSQPDPNKVFCSRKCANSRGHKRSVVPFTAKEQKQICQSYKKGDGVRVLATRFRCGDKRIMACLSDRGIPLKQKNGGVQPYKYDVDVFCREDAVSWYLLGAFMTDGCIKTRTLHDGSVSPSAVSISSKDKDWIEAIANLICPGNPIKKTQNECWDLRIFNGEIARWLISKGCGPRKSLTLKCPQVPKQWMADFLRGVIDGDGTVYCGRRKRKDGTSAKTGACAIATASKAFMTGLVKMLSSIGVETTVYVRQPGTRSIRGHAFYSEQPCYRIAINKVGDQRLLLQTVYYQGNKIAMARKEKSAQELIEWYERGFNCLTCNQPLHTTERHVKYCPPCLKERRRARARRRYREQNTTRASSKRSRT
jgi:hypothetical protein